MKHCLQGCTPPVYCCLFVMKIMSLHTCSTRTHSQQWISLRDSLLLEKTKRVPFTTHTHIWTRVRSGPQHRQHRSSGFDDLLTNLYTHTVLVQNFNISFEFLIVFYDFFLHIFLPFYPNIQHPLCIFCICLCWGTYTRTWFSAVVSATKDKSLID